MHRRVLGVFFFFQAEDGIRDRDVTGVQTCALPICMIEQLSTLAAQIVAANPDVIFAPVTPAALAARKVTKTIPIVFALSADPIGAGLVASLRQPGGNITGITSMNTELAAKRLELLREVAPRISRIAVFSNLDNVPDRQQV